MSLTKENSNKTVLSDPFSNIDTEKILNNNTLASKERLKSKKLIDELFENGNSVTVYPFKLLWMRTPLENPFPVNIGFAVSKKNFSKAVDRNKIKRMCREAYRMNKRIAYEFLFKKKVQCAFMLIYTSDQQHTFQEVNGKIMLTLERFIEGYEAAE